MSNCSSCPSHTHSAEDIHFQRCRFSTFCEHFVESNLPQSKPDIPSWLVPALSAHWLTKAHNKASLFPYLKEQVPTETSADFNLRVQESENKKKKGVWDRNEETPHKDAKEIIF